MIYEFMSNEQEQADAVPQPKHIWIDRDRIVVYTGEDMPKKGRDDIERERDAKLAAGVAWDGDRWHTDAGFQKDITAFVVAYDAGILPASAKVGVRTMTNTTRQLDAAQVKALAGVVMQHVQSVFAWSWAEKDKL